MMEWIWSLFSRERRDVEWSRRATYAAKYPFMPCVAIWAEEAKQLSYDKFFHDVHEERKLRLPSQTEKFTNYKKKARFMLPGSPRAWQWETDRASERHCVMVLTDDALNGSIYESGHDKHRVPQGPPYMTGHDLRDRFYRTNTNRPRVWVAEPSLSGYHFWFQRYVSDAPVSSVASLKAPSTTESCTAESVVGKDGLETPATSAPSTPQIGSFIQEPPKTGFKRVPSDVSETLISTVWGRPRAESSVESRGSTRGRTTRPFQDSALMQTTRDPSRGTSSEAKGMNQAGPSNPNRLNHRRPISVASTTSDASSTASSRPHNRNVYTPTHVTSRPSSIQRHATTPSRFSMHSTQNHPTFSRHPTKQSSNPRTSDATVRQSSRIPRPFVTPELPRKVSGTSLWSTGSSALQSSDMALREPLKPTRSTSTVTPKPSSHRLHSKDRSDGKDSENERIFPVGTRTWSTQNTTPSSTLRPVRAQQLPLPPSFMSTSPVLHRRDSNASSIRSSSPVKPDQLDGTLTRRSGNTGKPVPTFASPSPSRTRTAPFRTRGNSIELQE